MNDLVRLALVLAIGSTVGVCVYLIAERWNAHRISSPGSYGPRGWCQVCGAEVRGADLHEIRNRQDDAELHDGGSWTAAEFCAEHCPGGCLQEVAH